MIRIGKAIPIREMRQTCSGWSSQWEGKTKDGKYVYVRFRWGVLRVEIDQASLLEKTLSDALDGFLDETQLIDATRGQLDFSGTKWI